MISESEPEPEPEAEADSESEPEPEAEADSESEPEPEAEAESGSDSETQSYSGVPPLDRQFRPVVGRFYLHQHSEGDDDVPKWCPVKVYANGISGDVRQAQIEYWSKAYSKAADGTLRSHQADLGISDEQWEQQWERQVRNPRESEVHQVCAQTFPSSRWI